MGKRALLIGINYKGTSSALNGCINDVEHMRQYLRGKGYRNFTIMTDETSVKPTRRNIIAAILELLMSGETNLFLHYSGHGSHIPDLDGDEEDGQDETIVPLDYQREGLITDDQLRGLLEFMSPQSNLTIVLDCCHSGTGMDLAWKAQKKARTVRGRQREARWEMCKQAGYRKTPGSVVMLSGCMDAQYSADAWEQGKYQGALTFCLLKALKENPQTWNNLFTAVRNLLDKNRYEQKPCLSSGQWMNIDSTLRFC